MSAATASRAGQVLAMTVGGAEFGLPVESVSEVLRVPPISRLPFPPPGMIGVTSIRGEIVAVVDMGLRLLGTASSRDGRIVIARDPGTGENVGLLVDYVTGLVDADDTSPATPPEVEATLPAGWIAAVLAPTPDRLITVLELAPVLALNSDHVIPSADNDVILSEAKDLSTEES